MKVLWLVELCSNATCSKVRIGKCLSNLCPIRHCLLSTAAV